MAGCISPGLYAGPEALRAIVICRVYSYSTVTITVDQILAAVAVGPLRIPLLLPLTPLRPTFVAECWPGITPTLLSLSLSLVDP